MRSLGWAFAAALMFLLAMAVPGAAAEPTFRIRLAWGGGQARQWRGSVSIQGGTVTDPSPLGIEADEPGSIWSEGGATFIEQRSARGYDGCDLTVTAPEDARLTVRMSAAENYRQPVVIEVPLAELIASFHNSPLDDQGNRLLVQRRPGDTLRVRLAAGPDRAESDSLIYWAGETLHVEVTPHLIPLPDSTSLRMRCALAAARSEEELWTAERDFAAGATAAIPLTVPLPAIEGVYELSIAVDRSGLRSRISLSQPTVAQRKVQFVVLEKNPPLAPLRRERPPVEVEQIDPASASWWERLTSVPLVPGLRRGPLSGKYAEVTDHALGKLVRLPPAGADGPPAWEAYPLPVRDPGAPHVLEINLPADVAQSIGISVVEPNAVGAVMPIGLDSGVYRSSEGVEESARWSTHRLVFWPRTKSPLLLVTNRHATEAAMFGKIRLLRYDGRLPTAFDTRGPRPERLLAGFYARPLVAENFSAVESLDAASGRSLDDWVTFYQGATRLVDYLNHTGRNGLMLSVLSDGSTIYPSRLLQPTPRYDTGVFFASGQDPVRKDVLELLFRLFDREGLQLIPALHFSAPLPELEQLKRRGGPESIGLEWVGADGRTWLETNLPRRGQAPYYNPLNVRVQQSMLAVVRELADRYGRHASFSGVGVVLSAHGYAQLPGPGWGFDDDTVARYERDLHVRVPGAGAARFAARDQTLSGEQRDQWLQWRARSLAEFHGRMQAELSHIRSDAGLYLAGIEPLSGAASQQQLHPALPQSTSVLRALLEIGIEPGHYADQEGIVLARPTPVAPLDSLYTDSSRAVDLSIAQSTKLDARLSASGRSAGLLYHPPMQGRLESFEEASPFRPTYSWQVAQYSPAGRENRRRFAHAIATLDPQAIFDGGWLLPLGQEESLEQMVEVFRRLPGGRFRTLEADTQPVVIRTLTRGKWTYIYLVNDSPWPTTVEAGIAGPATARMESLSTRSLPMPIGMGPNRAWSVHLEPYDMIGVRLSAADVRLINPRTRLARPEVVVRLRTRIDDLFRRAAVLKKQREIGAPQNCGFESPADRMNQVPGWVAASLGVPEISVETYEPHSGRQSVRFMTDGASASFWSDPFQPPRTGRLSVSVWLRTPDPARQPPLRLAVEGNVGGTSYYRYARVGSGGAGVEPLTTQWSQFVFPVSDLPLEGLSDVRVRLDMMGPGEAWIDDVEVFESAFSVEELTELLAITQLASDYLDKGRLGDCHHLLEGYWPRFLADRVKMPLAPIAGDGTPSQNAGPPMPAEKPGFIQTWKNRLVPGFLR